jgi:hypothetical protein
MNLLYNSDTFSVVHLQMPDTAQPRERADLPLLQREGFEIVDKRSGKEIYLEGQMAQKFELQLRAWEAHSPTQEEVETILDGYTFLAQNPVHLH